MKNAANEINEVINDDNYQDKINTIARQDEFCVIVYSDKGITLTSKEGDPRCKISELNYQSYMQEIQQLKQEALINGSASKLIEEDDFKERIPFEILQSYPKVYQLPKEYKKNAQNMTYVSVVRTDQNQLVAILISAQLTPVNATVDTIKAQFAMIAAILIIIAIILAFFLSKKIATPIISINNSAKQLAKGDYDVHFAGKGYLEIQELNDTLNYAAKELGKVDGLRKELIANMSHDLRTPLTMISGYSEVMRDIPGENTPENVQIIIDETKRLTNLVNDMLDLSKLQAGVQELHASEMNITEEIRNILHRYDVLLNEQDYQITFDYAHEVLISGDQIKLNQVVYNLINNAINYSGDDHQILVSQTMEGDRVKIAITDHGPGIEKEQLPYIWDRYYKVDKTHVRSKVGSGLGLSIVKTVLELHHAKYGVISEIGKGSTFWFSLPYVALNHKNE